MTTPEPPAATWRRPVPLTGGTTSARERAGLRAGEGVGAALGVRLLATGLQLRTTTATTSGPAV